MLLPVQGWCLPWCHSTPGCCMDDALPPPVTRCTRQPASAIPQVIAAHLLSNHPSPLLGVAEGRGLAASSTPQLLQPWLCWNELFGHKEHFESGAAGRKRDSLSAWITRVPQPPPLTSIPFAADGRETSAHLMDHLRVREMGGGSAFLLFCMEFAPQPWQCHDTGKAPVLAAGQEPRCSIPTSDSRSGSCHTEAGGQDKSSISRGDEPGFHPSVIASARSKEVLA